MEGFGFLVLDGEVVVAEPERIIIVPPILLNAHCPGVRENVNGTLINFLIFVVEGNMDPLVGF